MDNFQGCSSVMGRMKSSRTKSSVKAATVIGGSPSQLKTSAEIISEARSSLRILKTQRPFTPKDDQRKLFGSTSSRTPENRPPSAFSLHARSFEGSDSRPISGARLTPLDFKPKIPTSPSKDEGPPIPKPPLDPIEIKRVSNARARLFKVASQGNLLPDKAIHPEETIKRLNSDSSLNIKGFSLDADESALSQFNTKDLANKNTECGGEEMILPSRMREHVGLLSTQTSLGSKQNKQDNRPSTCSDSTEIIKQQNRTGSASGPRAYEGETEEEILYWNTKIQPILDELRPLNNGNDVEHLCKTCSSLHRTLQEGNMLGKMCKRRAILLKTLYKLVDVGSDQLSIQLAKLILALKVSGKNLLNICKLMFKVSRSENNDVLFQNDKILDCMVEVFSFTDPLGNIDAFLYCMGTIKFLSGNMILLKDLLNKGLIETLVQLMKEINDANRTSDTYLCSSGHLLVQVTATLRNLADLPQSRSRFLSTGALLELCVVLEQHITDKDICTNVARIFSKLSAYNDCCLALSECTSCYQLFLAILHRHQRKQDLVVRVVFILGNMTAKNNKAREELYKQKHSVKTLLTLFQTYHELDVKVKISPPKIQSKSEMDETRNQRPSEVEDILIKLIRVIANLSINTEVGSALSGNQNCVDLLIKVLENRTVAKCEELMMNAAASINNLSYYQVKNSAVRARQLHIAELLMKLLLCNNMDAILEAARVFGNLSRSKEVRDFIVQKNVDKFMITLLDAKHQDVCFAACGVLINLTVDKSKRSTLKQDGGIKKLIDCLRDFGPTDWQLASLVCKTLWNYSEKITNAVLCFGEKETSELLELLPAYLELAFVLFYVLDEEIALDIDTNGFDEGLVEHQKVCWESEFVPVARQLLHRIQCHQSHLETLPFSSLQD
ncbi:armadillo repeat-containing protein 2 isoform X3 [Carcharodon carcharias]|uniref:armadillo repeat-containing protein 2 isoform X3 n=1 Tax=Carcharodon carcharias TaxID=13397 RepID=UPI001B7EC025|nr:armadillo repeat-containing protein 2 isoform X3 [Carcharodon carcharias]XP_041044510.1 armadillo repeat-containing protein 2 isoform X3 [Carcharodon carcharias]